MKNNPTLYPALNSAPVRHLHGKGKDGRSLCGMTLDLGTKVTLEEALARPGPYPLCRWAECKDYFNSLTKDTDG